ncbi:hypothetical protein CEXT_233411 [Caerostris extrusa]|uniref:Akirin n=1 Tax=Caerostris extrusa TaxID=172846 RepID=A0AAV4X2Z4_CAEEX|nr:hypothetical protein CEXT_233411 [Caerostris extrusa]
MKRRYFHNGCTRSVAVSERVGAGNEEAETGIPKSSGLQKISHPCHTARKKTRGTKPPLGRQRLLSNVEELFDFMRIRCEKLKNRYLEELEETKRYYLQTEREIV